MNSFVIIGDACRMGINGSYHTPTCEQPCVAVLRKRWLCLFLIVQKSESGKTGHAFWVILPSYLAATYFRVNRVLEQWTTACRLWWISSSSSDGQLIIFLLRVSENQAHACTAPWRTYGLAAAWRFSEAVVRRWTEVIFRHVRSEFARCACLGVMTQPRTNVSLKLLSAHFLPPVVAVVSIKKRNQNLFHLPEHVSHVKNIQQAGSWLRSCVFCLWCRLSTL